MDVPDINEKKSLKKEDTSNLTLLVTIVFILIGMNSDNQFYEYSTFLLLLAHIFRNLEERRNNNDN
ncbi:unnamed protein product [Cunninghamella echinulata]